MRSRLRTSFVSFFVIGVIVISAIAIAARVYISPTTPSVVDNNVWEVPAEVTASYLYQLQLSKQQATTNDSNVPDDYEGPRAGNSSE